MTATPSTARDDHVAPRQPSALGTRISRGLGWSLLGQGVSRAFVFAAGLALARLLAPIDFGEVAAGLTVASVALAINELGVIPALVRGVGEVRSASATAATIAFANSAAIYCAAFLVAPAVARLTNTPGSVGVIRIMALSVLVDGAIAVPLAMLYRDLRTVVQVTAEVGGMAAYAGTALALASFGLDGEAVAWGRVAGAAVTGVVIAAAGRWPARPSFDLSIARSLLTFGFPLAASTAVLESVMNVDYLIVGRELYGAALGVYLLAFNLSSWPVSVLSVAIARVSFAGYSALCDDHERLDRGFAHSVAVALSFTVPLVALLMWLASDLVALLYGPAWMAAAAPLRWLVLIGGVRVMLTMAGEVLAVTGRVGTVLWLRVVWLAALPVPLMVGAEAGGLRGVAMAHVLVGMVLVVPLFLWRLHNAGFDLAPLARSVARPLLAAMAAVLSMSVLGRLVSAPVTRIVVLGAMGAGVYALALLPANPVVRTLWRQLRGRGAVAELA